MSQKKYNRDSKQNKIYHKKDKKNRRSGLGLIAFFCIGLLAGAAFFFGQYALSYSRLENTSKQTEKQQQGAKQGRWAANMFPCFKRATDCLFAERYSEAFKEFRKASKLAPEDPRPHYGLGEATCQGSV